ncbi:MAG: 3-dehydroquinate synthase [Armatimonadota bacterium]
MQQRVRVELGQAAYDIVVGAGLLASTGELLGDSLQGREGLLVTNRRVADLYGPQTLSGLERGGLRASLVVVPPGERSKTLGQTRKLYDRLLEAGIDRSGFVAALGGGVVGDLAGFAAATYMRGIDFVQLPTTLLAQVDASVGGKVAVDLPQGKNLVGAFWQPRAVLADVATLRTLPRRELRGGLAEVVRHAVIADPELFRLLEEQAEAVLAADLGHLTEIVRRSCLVKAGIVAQDERESGLRALLNLGHTIGHALEQVYSYRTLRHGEAVSLGMVAEGRLAVRRGMFAEEDLSRLVRLLERLGLPVGLAELDAAAVGRACLVDKKRLHGRLRVTLPRGIGRAELVADVSPQELEWAAGTLASG